jgi:Transposase DNA-binding
MHEDWAAEEMSGATLRDRRRFRSVIRICTAVAERPDLSFSAACGPAVRQAAHRIFEHPDTSVAALLEGHFQTTAQRCASLPLVLITCVFVYDQQKILGLGSVNGSQRSGGLFGHAALAMTPAGTPLGLWQLELWGAHDEGSPTEAGQTSGPGEKESEKWHNALEAVAQRLPEETQGLLIQDREADIFDFLVAERPARLELLVRARHDRKIDYETLAEPAAGGEPATACRTERGKLFAVAASAPVVGCCSVTIARQSARGRHPAREERQARLEVRLTEVRLQRPRQSSAAAQAEVTVFVIHALEREPPAGQKAVHWVLLCTVPVETLEDACRMLGYYARRWVIERLHYTLKSGLGAEKLQIDDAVSLAHALSLYYVVAWRLLHLAYTAREEPDWPAVEILGEEAVAVLVAHSSRRVETVRDAVTEIARLGGYVPYRSAPPPGVKVLWQGLRQLEAMVLGWRLARGHSLPQDLMIHG